MSHGPLQASASASVDWDCLVQEYLETWYFPVQNLPRTSGERLLLLQSELCSLCGYGTSSEKEAWPHRKVDGRIGAG